MKLTDFEGKEVEILEIEIIKYQKERKVYNFSVEGTRNYYVGEERLLNHNLDDCIGGTGILLDDETKINDNKRKIENELGKNIEDFRLNEESQEKHDPNHKNYQSERHKSEVKDKWLDENFIGRDSKGMITAFISVYYYPNEIRNLKNQIIWSSNELDEEDKQLVDDTHRRIMENIKIGEKYLKFLLKIKNKKIQENSDIKEWMKTNEKIGKQYLEYLNSLGKLKNEIEK